VGEHPAEKPRANMKFIVTLLGILCVPTHSFGQGGLVFANSAAPATLISAGGGPMPARTSLDTTYYFAIFLAPSSTVTNSGITPGFSDPTFQIVDPQAYTTNSPSTAGRLPYKSIDIGAAQGFGPGSAVDFIVRGWSANAGTTWTEARANWNDGSPLGPMFIGSSTIGNDFLLVGGTAAYPTVFGPAHNQILGFDMIFVPEPSALALAVLGGVTLLVSSRGRLRQQLCGRESGVRTESQAPI